MLAVANNAAILAAIGARLFPHTSGTPRRAPCVPAAGDTCRGHLRRRDRRPLHLFRGGRGELSAPTARTATTRLRCCGGSTKRAAPTPAGHLASAPSRSPALRATGPSTTAGLLRACPARRHLRGERPGNRGHLHRAHGVDARRVGAPHGGRRISEHPHLSVRLANTNPYYTGLALTWRHPRALGQGRRLSGGRQRRRRHGRVGSTSAGPTTRGHKKVRFTSTASCSTSGATSGGAALDLGTTSRWVVGDQVGSPPSTNAGRSPARVYDTAQPLVVAEGSTRGVGAYRGVRCASSPRRAAHGPVIIGVGRISARTDARAGGAAPVTPAFIIRRRDRPSPARASGAARARAPTVEATLATPGEIREE